MPDSTPPKPPYYAVVFASDRTADDEEGYQAAAERMEALARAMPGFLGIDTVRGADGHGITVSYWDNEASIRAWQQQAEHRAAQQMGRERWYSRYELRVCRVERAWEFPPH